MPIKYWRAFCRGFYSGIVILSAMGLIGAFSITVTAAIYCIFNGVGPFYVMLAILMAAPIILGIQEAYWESRGE